METIRTEHDDFYGFFIEGDQPVRTAKVAETSIKNALSQAPKTVGTYTVAAGGVEVTYPYGRPYVGKNFSGAKL